MNLLLVLFLLFLLLLVFGGGGWGYSRYGVAGGVGPLGVALIVLLALYFTGNLRV